MKTAVLSVTAGGARLGQKVAQEMRERSGAEVDCFEKRGKESGLPATLIDSLKPYMEGFFETYDRMLFIMATGIVVRTIAPYVVHKSKDPAILVSDERGRHIISLLSGHLGGANEWAEEVAGYTGGTAVITTATDVNGLPAPDVLARKAGFTITDFDALKRVNAAIVEGRNVPYYVDVFLFKANEYEAAVQEHAGEVRPFFGDAGDVRDLFDVTNDAYRIIVTDRVIKAGQNTLLMRPKSLAVGIGCRRGTTAERIREGVTALLAELKLAEESVLTAASVDLKADEEGLLEAVKALGWPIRFYTKSDIEKKIEEMEEVGPHITNSEFVNRTIGVGNVCETTALLAANSRRLVRGKTVYPGMTVAVARVR